MGYTHYWKWNGEVDARIWQDALINCQSIIRHSDVPLDVEFNPEGFFINGVDEGAHETFVIPRHPKPIDFEFCKTARKPYDKIVMACLAVLADCAGFVVSSDGDPEEWTIGVYFARLVTETDWPNPIKES